MSFILQKFKAIKNILFNKPCLLVFNVTRRCNQHCLMCNIPQITEEISLEEIKILANKLKKFGICEVYLQGGEPLLRKDIIEIIDIFIRNSIRPSVITNGELLNKKIIEEISKRKCNLYVSIDTFIPELYKKLRGNDSLNKVLSNISHFKNIKPKGIFAVTSTITQFSTKEDLKNIQNFGKELNISYYVRPYNYNLDKAGARNEALICENEKSIEILDYFNKNSFDTNFLFSLIYEENIAFLKGKRYGFCDALRYTMVLNEDGKISPCIEHTDIKFDLSDYKNQSRKLRDFIKNCNKNTPCIYGCTRNIGFIVKNKIYILKNILKVLKLF